VILPDSAIFIPHTISIRYSESFPESGDVDWETFSRIENERVPPANSDSEGERGAERRERTSGHERKDVDDKWRVISKMESGDAGIGMNNGRRAA